ncbi:hypothetical protein FisN_9Lh042 [Fistulifera solaris]|uniref:Uncharacterized protein n=1 Tax=Fistulifera solaris TaxID=1519565 RepID=A0A1Z5KKW9_FISSO|nr:hypothetical protein FisN_9Lh042 [Fistulifera solaris]|eukprot:GAX26775.1 hypothetical protein FisN_9Lh042 [Fistulifera solaris]
MENTKEGVVLKELGWLNSSKLEKLEEWPPEEILAAALSDDTSTGHLQQGARNALLQKYGYKSWESLISRAFDKQKEVPDELIELLTTGKSNQRPLQWALMDCMPGCQFRLHAHPNIELVYCMEGALHEIRMDGLPFTKSFDSDGAGEGILIGPSVTQLQRPWKFGTLQKGTWLVNEVGSIHKSFTASNCGCKLLVLWGGSHANIPEEPSMISEAVRSMDEKVCACHAGEMISETFLPNSERNKRGSEEKMKG